MESSPIGEVMDAAATTAVAACQEHGIDYEHIIVLVQTHQTHDEDIDGEGAGHLYRANPKYDKATSADDDLFTTTFVADLTNHLVMLAHASGVGALTVARIIADAAVNVLGEDPHFNSRDRDQTRKRMRRPRKHGG